MDTFVLIDANALIHRAYHAVPKTLRSPSGQAMNAVYGFTGILLGILENEKPSHFAAAFDKSDATFRDALMPEYKATRKKTEDDLISQFPLIREVLAAFSIPIFEKSGFEADDYLGILSTRIQNENAKMKILLITNDQDAYQLVNENVLVVSPVSGYSKVTRMDSDAVMAKLGVSPSQIPDFKGLRGDSSDNIKGVPGIGPKTASELLKTFGNLENIYENLEKVQSERVRMLLKENEDSARLSKNVATILREDEDLNFQMASCEMHDFDFDKVKSTFENFGFKGPLNRASSLHKMWKESAKKIAEDRQASLFA